MKASQPVQLACRKRGRPLFGAIAYARYLPGAADAYTSRKPTLNIWGILPMTDYGLSREFPLSAKTGR